MPHETAAVVAGVSVSCLSAAVWMTGNGFWLNYHCIQGAPHSPPASYRPPKGPTRCAVCLGAPENVLRLLYGAGNCPGAARWGSSGLGVLLKMGLWGEQTMPGIASSSFKDAQDTALDVSATGDGWGGQGTHPAPAQCPSVAAPGLPRQQNLGNGRLRAGWRKN